MLKTGGKENSIESARGTLEALIYAVDWQTLYFSPSALYITAYRIVLRGGS